MARSEGFRGYPIKFLLAGLFLIAIISFASKMGTNYGYSSDFMKSDRIDFSALETQLNETSADAEKWQESFQSDNPLLSYGSLILFSLWGISKLMWGFVATVLDIYLSGLSNVLGIPSIVIGSITAVIIISLVFYLWRVIKAGE